MQITVKTFGPIRKDSDEYKALRTKLKDRKRFRVWDLPCTNKPAAGTYNVETKHLFGNQSNTVEGRRIFDFADYSARPDVEHIRYGHYIEDISELESARDLRATCGYCGNQQDGASGQWCPKCRGSEHMKPGDYHLLHMLPVSSTDKRDTQPPADVMASIEKAQSEAAKARAEKAIADKLHRLDLKVTDAKLEAEFILACVDAGLHTHHLGNLIYYSHTGEFCFGWRNALSDTERDEIQFKLRAANIHDKYPITFK